MNSVLLIGRATRDPEMFDTNAGNQVARITLAVDGYNDATSFITCVAYSKTAEVVGKFVRKGSQIGITGRLNQRTYENSEGKKTSVTEVICDNVDLLEKKPEDKKSKKD